MSFFPRSHEVLFLACLLPGCISGNLSHERRGFAPEPSSILALQPGACDLTDCLAVLGAPLVVREDRDQTILVWGWRHAGFWSLSGSIPLGRGVNATLAYSDQQENLDALLGLFDSSLRLVLVRRGKFGELVQRQKPRLVQG